jgi:hypothetical protein
MILFSAFSLKLALGAAAALAAISLSPGSAQAFVVTVGGAQFDVTTFSGRYNDNSSKFETAASGGVMPWWGNSTMAYDFATAIGTSLGIYAENPGGPLFAYDVQSLNNYYWFSRADDSFNIVNGYIGNDQVRDYAEATPLAAPVPGPLPLFGAAAAFGFSRKLRKRIKLAPGAFSSALPRA